MPKSNREKKVTVGVRLYKENINFCKQLKETHGLSRNELARQAICYLLDNKDRIHEIMESVYSDDNLKVSPDQKDKRQTLYITSKHVEELDKLADQLGTSRSHIIQMALLYKRQRYANNQQLCS